MHNFLLLIYVHIDQTIAYTQAILNICIYRSCHISTVYIHTYNAFYIKCVSSSVSMVLLFSSVN